MTNQNLQSNQLHLWLSQPAFFHTRSIFKVLPKFYRCKRLFLLLSIALSGVGIVILPDRTVWAASGEAGTAQDVWQNQGLFIAQDIMEGLPPPPSGLPPQELPSPGRAVQPADLPPTSGDRALRGAGSRYMVIVNGDSPRLLAQVQRVESGAMLQEYQGQRFIQVATFESSDYAERQVQILASRGIGAKIVSLEEGMTSALSPARSTQAQSIAQSRPQRTATPDLPPPDLLPTQPVPREIEFGGQNSSVNPPTLNQFPSPPSLPSDSNSDSNAAGEGLRGLQPDAAQSEPPERVGRAYYVVIPGKQSELDAISNQVIRLGDGLGIAQIVQQGNSRGPHVQVGPFADRNAANRWSRYFRSFGMDARVFVD